MSAPVVVGVSLKTYLGHGESLAWLASVARLALQRRAVQEGAVSLFVIPTFLQVLPALELFAGSPVAVGAQDVSAYPPGPYTGEVSASELAEVGVRLVEVGHAERRRLFGETDASIREKVQMTLLHRMTPVLCVGESDRLDPAAAAAVVRRQVLDHLSGAPGGRVIVAYEPIWAIGAASPASSEYIGAVADGVRSTLDDLPDRGGSSVIYGGSAGPGLLSSLGGSIDGLFLGRLAHNPTSLAQVLDEAADRARDRRSE